jgi:hypothetical protein
MISKGRHVWSKEKTTVLPLKLAGSQASAQDRRSALALYMVMEFLPPSDKERMSYCCWCEEPGIHSWATLVFEDPSSLYVLFDLLSGFEEFMKK